LSVVLVLVLLSTGFGLVGPLLMGRAIDGYIATKTPSGLAIIGRLDAGHLLLAT